MDERPTRIGTPPVDAAEAVARLRAAAIPPEILEVAATLQDAGHAAVLVGGAVRDALLQLAADDWDLATSATPEEVQRIFPRTLPTGVEHGTVTVLVRPRHGKGKASPVEVTTFRGEGAYVDGRHPSEVVFLRELDDDLARRDFTVNAFAWDPRAEAFRDPFGGLADLQAARLRAVGDPTQRFHEDGLRTIRAVRFCATRGLALDEATAAAIPEALEVLDRVSRERVWTEFGKLLAAPRPSLGLLPMIATGMWSHVVAPVPPELLREAVAHVDLLPRDAVLRLARLLRPLAQRSDDDRRAAFASFVALKPSKQDRQRLEALLGPAACAVPDAASMPEMRAHVAALGRVHLDDVLAIFGCDAEHSERLRTAVDGIPLTARELPVTGRDLQQAGIVQPGPAMGRVLDGLLQRIWSDPSLRERERLLEVARTLADDVSPSL